MIIKMLGIGIGVMFLFRWRYRIMSVGLYIPFIRRYVVAKEFQKMKTMMD